jgi:hypothetical protein
MLLSSIPRYEPSDKSNKKEEIIEVDSLEQIDDWDNFIKAKK